MHTVTYQQILDAAREVYPKHTYKLTVKIDGGYGFKEIFKNSYHKIIESPYVYIDVDHYNSTYASMTHTFFIGTCIDESKQQEYEQRVIQTELNPPDIINLDHYEEIIIKEVGELYNSNAGYLYAVEHFPYYTSRTEDQIIFSRGCQDRNGIIRRNAAKCIVENGQTKWYDVYMYWLEHIKSSHDFYRNPVNNAYWQTYHFRPMLNRAYWGNKVYSLDEQCMIRMGPDEDSWLPFDRLYLSLIKAHLPQDVQDEILMMDNVERL